MSNELEEKYKFLKNSILSTQIKWHVAKQLFASGSQENLDLMNWSANFFFWSIRPALLETVVMAICRVTDPASTGAYDNLSLYRLAVDIGKTDSLKKKIIENCLTGKNDTFKVLRDVRRKLYAHSDLEEFGSRSLSALEVDIVVEIDNAIEAIIDIVNKIGELLGYDVALSKDFKYHFESSFGDGAVLLNALRKQRASHDRLIRGRELYEQAQLPQIVHDKILKQDTIPFGTVVDNLVYELYGLTEEDIQEFKSARLKLQELLSPPHT